MKKLLLLLLISACASCKRDLRSNDICIVDSDARKANCANLRKRYELNFPEKLVNWYAFSGEDFLILGNALEECELGRRPKDPLSLMDICRIDMVSCGRKSLSQIDGFYAIEPTTMRKVVQRIDFCLR